MVNVRGRINEPQNKGLKPLVVVDKLLAGRLVYVELEGALLIFLCKKDIAFREFQLKYKSYKNTKL